MMNVSRSLSVLAVGVTLAIPAVSPGQYDQNDPSRAKASQARHDARHHTTAKVIGGSAAGGAVVGGLLGGGKGALIGAGAGAGGGAIADKVRKDKGVKKRRQRENGDYR